MYPVYPLCPQTGRDRWDTRDRCSGSVSRICECDSDNNVALMLNLTHKSTETHIFVLYEEISKYHATGYLYEFLKDTSQV